jgi:hypothetical protein
MAYTDGYKVVTPSKEPPKGSPGTEKTNQGKSSPGPDWAK